MLLQKRLLKGRGRIIPALMVLMAIAAGCAQTPVSGVSVKSLAADLVFGIPELPEPAAPPNSDLTPTNPTGVISTGGRGPRFPSTPPPPPPPECEVAEPTEFPDKEASTVVQGSPSEGFYKWVVDKEQVIPNVGSTHDHDFVERSIEDVGISGGNLLFTTVERDLVFGADARVVKQTFEVRQGPGKDEGIYMIRRTSKSGSRQEEIFRPLPPILMLDLPVKAGNTSNSTGVDPETLEVQQQEGFVEGQRKRVDACGTMIDSWFVNGHYTFTTRTRERIEVNYDYAIATQLGGFIVFEHIEAPRNDPRLKIDARIGQVEPSSKSQLN